jgi:hypothetical protein
MPYAYFTLVKLKAPRGRFLRWEEYSLTVVNAKLVKSELLKFRNSKMQLSIKNSKDFNADDNISFMM